ncbi:MAG: hypothetical protein QOI73_1390 [Solirubrobacteraceae bacterium]|nr:hypothetical protein [Solirubrobacteraceae bacterium]
MSDRNPRPSERLVAALTGSVAGTMGDLYGQRALGTDAEVFTPTDVARQAKDVLERAKHTAVLVDDGTTTHAIETWNRWRCERGATDLLEGLIPRKAKGISDLRSVRVDWRPQGGFSEDLIATFMPSEQPPAAHFAATDVHRSTRRVLDTAKEHPVFIDHKHTLLTIDDWGRRRFESAVLGILQDVRQFQGARVLHEGEDPSTWALVTPYPWTAALPREELDEFADELLPYLLESVLSRELDRFLSNLRGWHAACEIHASETLQKRLALPIDPTRLMELSAPGDVPAIKSRSMIKSR